MRMVLFGVGMLLAACGNKYVAPCVDDAPLRYVEARAVFQTHCTRCHASTVVGELRNGAPEGINFDTYEGAFLNAEAAQRMVAAGRMPADNPDSLADEDRCVIEGWVQQGMPE